MLAYIARRMGLMKHVFKSEVDGWFYGATLGLPVLMLPIFFTIEDSTEQLVFLMAIGSTIAFAVWLLSTTRYTIDEESLLVNSGPFRWRVPLAEINGVTPSRSVLSAPALSLNRLRVDYGNNRYLLLSPVNRDDFVRCLMN